MKLPITVVHSVAAAVLLMASLCSAADFSIVIPVRIEPGAERSDAEAQVVFADTNLAAGVRSVLRIPEGDPVPLERAERIQELALRAKGIRDLGGMESFTSLVSLSLTSNHVERLGPLASLEQLEELDLDANAVSDMTPLVGLGGLSRLNLAHNQIASLALLPHLRGLGLKDRIDLRGNPLECRREARVLATMRKRGVHTETDCD